MTEINGTAKQSLASVIVLTNGGKYFGLDYTTTLFILTAFALREEGQGCNQRAFRGQNENKLTEQIISNRNVSFPKKEHNLYLFFFPSQISSNSWCAYSVKL
jgi:hypothetical protein